MKWISKHQRMPDTDSEYEDRTQDVLVTDGENWGYGNYSHTFNYWTYYFVGITEQSDNKITHWAEPLILPKIEPEYDVLKAAIDQIKNISACPKCGGDRTVYHNYCKKWVCIDCKYTWM